MWRSALIACLLTMLVSRAVAAANRVWSGAVDDRWSVGANWIGGTAPLDGDSLYFSATAARTISTNDIDGLDIHSMYFSNSGSTDYTFQGKPITIAAGITDTPCLCTRTWNIDLNLTATQKFEIGGSWIFGGAIDLATNTLTFHATSRFIEIAGPILGSGTLVLPWYDVTLSGISPFEGRIEVTGVGLAIHGSVSNAAINARHTSIGGRGSLGSATLTEAYLGPWGRLTARSVTMNHGLFLCDIVTPTPHLFDQLRVTERIVLNNPILSIDLMTTPTLGTQYVIIDNAGSEPVFGMFHNRPEGLVFPVERSYFLITYRGGDGNDVVLTATNQPPLIPLLNDPARLLLIVLLSVFGIGVLRRAI